MKQLAGDSNAANTPKIGVYYAGNERLFAEAFVSGLRRHGIEPVFAGHWRGNELPEVDILVFWSHRRNKRVMAEQLNAAAYLVLERGYVGDRFRWTMVGLNGLNGRADFNHGRFGGWLQAPADRWQRLQAIERIKVRDWKPAKRVESALIIGQVPGDASLERVDINQWYQEAAVACRAQGIQPLFRAHPIAKSRDLPLPENIDVLDCDLDRCFAQVDLVITYSSNTGVLAAIAGVPVFAADAGSMASLVAIDQWDSLCQPVRPDRDGWLAGLAWTQWLPEEISNGQAWEHIGPRTLALVENSRGFAGANKPA